MGISLPHGTNLVADLVLVIGPNVSLWVMLANDADAIIREVAGAA
jgi:hypothetical protein